MENSQNFFSKFKASCRIGYTNEDLKKILEHFKISQEQFNGFMAGKTFGICDGYQYDYELKKYKPDQCVNSPHGDAYYTYDVQYIVYKILESKKAMDELTEILESFGDYDKD